jgi:hypothetical protein
MLLLGRQDGRDVDAEVVVMVLVMDSEIFKGGASFAVPKD